jgi:hypothetical protein
MRTIPKGLLRRRPRSSNKHLRSRKLIAIELAVLTLDRDSRSLREVIACLARIEDRGYGICDVCEEEIKPRRLDAVPWTRHGWATACSVRRASAGADSCDDGVRPAPTDCSMKGQQAVPRQVHRSMGMISDADDVAGAAGDRLPVQSLLCALMCFYVLYVFEFPGHGPSPGLRDRIIASRLASDGSVTLWLRRDRTYARLAR